MQIPPRALDESSRSSRPGSSVGSSGCLKRSASQVRALPRPCGGVNPSFNPRAGDRADEGWLSGLTWFDSKTPPNFACVAQRKSTCPTRRRRWFDSIRTHFDRSRRPTVEPPGSNPGRCRFESCREQLHTKAGRALEASATARPARFREHRARTRQRHARRSSRNTPR